jgi:hypothetical protein
MPDGPTTDIRSRLRSAIAAREAAKEKHNAACRAEEHGQRLLSDARAALRAISENGAVSANERAQALVAHASGEGPAPAYETAADLGRDAKPRHSQCNASRRQRPRFRF